MDNAIGEVCQISGYLCFLYRTDCWQDVLTLDNLPHNHKIVMTGVKLNVPLYYDLPDDSLA